jgi:hypothetical protein
MSGPNGRHTCGDAGGVKVETGQPCGQGTGAGKRCVWHPANVDGPAAAADHRSSVARRGGLAFFARSMLPAKTPHPDFDSIEAITRYAQARAHLVETGKLDAKLSAEARGWATLALQALDAIERRRLADVLVSIEGGGAALVLLTRLTESLAEGRRRPLPGRVVAMSAPRGDDA